MMVLMKLPLIPAKAGIHDQERLMICGKMKTGTIAWAPLFSGVSENILGLRS